MNPFDDRFRDAQSNVPSLTGITSSDQKNAGLLFKKITDLIVLKFHIEAISATA
jgi:hypothetical protein